MGRPCSNPIPRSRFHPSISFKNSASGGGVGGGGESEAASYGRQHEKEARRKLEQILGLQIAEAKKVIDKGRRRSRMMTTEKGNWIRIRSTLMIRILVAYM